MKLCYKCMKLGFFVRQIIFKKSNFIIFLRSRQQQKSDQIVLPILWKVTLKMEYNLRCCVQNIIQIMSLKCMCYVYFLNINIIL